MERARAAARALVPALLALGLSQAAEAGNVNFTLGTRQFTDSALEPVEEQAVVGVNVEWNQETLPFSLVVGLHRSSDDRNVGAAFRDRVSAELTVVDLSFGIAKIWDKHPHARPFVGGGLSLIHAEAEVSFFGLTEGDEAVELGLYLDGGIFWRVGKTFNVGITGRYTLTEVEDDVLFERLNDFEADLDSLQVGMILGWGW